MMACSIPLHHQARWTVLLLVTAVLISSSCLIVSIFKSGLLQNNNTQPHPDSDSQVCVRSELVQKQSDERLRKLHKHENNGQEEFCAETNEEISALLELIFKTKGKSVINDAHFGWPGPGGVTGRQVSAHKRLLPPVPHNPESARTPQFFNKSNVALLLNSEADADSSIEHAHNVEVLSSGLHVLHSGMYYVYSSVFFSPKGDQPCEEYASQTWHHNVLRIRSNDRSSSGAIHRSLHTCCDDCTRDKETSYAGGAFFLQAGDHLSVEVSGDGLVRFDKQSSYLGLYMLGANS